MRLLTDEKIDALVLQTVQLIPAEWTMAGFAIGIAKAQDAKTAALEAWDEDP